MRLNENLQGLSLNWNFMKIHGIFHLKHIHNSFSSSVHINKGQSHKQALSLWYLNTIPHWNEPRVLLEMAGSSLGQDWIKRKITMPETRGWLKVTWVLIKGLEETTTEQEENSLNFNRNKNCTGMKQIKMFIMIFFKKKTFGHLWKILGNQFKFWTLINKGGKIKHLSSFHINYNLG